MISILKSTKFIDIVHILTIQMNILQLCEKKSLNFFCVKVHLVLSSKLLIVMRAEKK